MGAALIVSAHLLPVINRGSPVAVRVMGRVLWGAYMVTACLWQPLITT